MGTNHDQSQDSTFSLCLLRRRNNTMVFEVSYSLHDHGCAVTIADQNDVFAILESGLKQADYCVGICCPLNICYILAYRRQIHRIDVPVAHFTELDFDLTVHASSMKSTGHKNERRLSCRCDCTSDGKGEGKEVCKTPH